MGILAGCVKLIDGSTQVTRCLLCVAITIWVGGFVTTNGAIMNTLAAYEIHWRYYEKTGESCMQPVQITMT